MIGELKGIGGVTEQLMGNRRAKRMGRRDGSDSCDVSFASTWRSSVKEDIMSRPMEESKHGYRGTLKSLTFCTYDIQCCWCLEMGHDIHHCPNEKMVVVKSKDEIVVGPESSVEIEEVEEFGVVDKMFVEQYAVGGESIYDVVHSVHIEEDSHTCNALVEFCSTSEICSGVREEQYVSLVELDPNEILEDKLEFRNVGEIENKSELA